jgi:hypothetical protein
MTRNQDQDRRQFAKACAATGASLLLPHVLSADEPENASKKIVLFDGKTLEGWHAMPRILPEHFPNYEESKIDHAKWTIEDGVLSGGQDPPGCGLGGWLLSDKKYGDFELYVDAKPDWSVDTGIYIRTTDSGAGFQVLLDHRDGGAIGFIYGKNIGGFHARPYEFWPKRDANGKVIGLIPKDVATADRIPMNYAASSDAFLKAWKFADWNTFKIRCVGKYPVITTWINGVKICEFDTGTLKGHRYDREKTAHLLGREGHIALEVHAGTGVRWAKDAVCRWKNVYLYER